jgi:hypothetical protein
MGVGNHSSCLDVMKTKLLLGLSVLLLGAWTFRAQQPDFTGTWTLNRDVTDSLAKLRPHIGEDGRPGRRPGGGRGGVTGVSAEFPEGDPNAGDIVTNAEKMRNILDVIDDWNRGNEEIAITPSNQGIRITYADSTVLILPADGANRKFPFRNFDVVQAKSAWKDGRLVANYKVRGFSLQETYERGVDSPRLIVTTQVPGTMRPLTFRRVYDLNTR